MNAANHLRVLDAICNTFEGRIYTIADRTQFEDVHGITWTTLLGATGLPESEVKRSVSVLLGSGLVRQGSSVVHPLRRVFGRRPPVYFWVTPVGRKLLIEFEREAQAWT
ncbi:MAG: hypothetical protein JWM58_2173 [Rhizobium sp.]|nr:hypothetical protein [Rhizobium sp.]